jgi:DNA (cytosine-5)-methyltransferase 1
MKSRPTAIDLFSGGGGLTVGLKAAGFSVCAAVEFDRLAAETYSENHPEVVMITRDIKTVTADELVRCSPTGKIDLIAACPPCQSFSSLTSRYKKKDARDKLIFEFARLVEQIKPQTIMMENVPGLALKGEKLFNPVMRRFKALGYKIEYKVLEVADYGVPQNRKRLVVLGSLSSGVKIPEPTHNERAEFGKQKWRTVKDAIGHLPEPISLSKSKTKGGPRKFDWHVSRDLGSINIERLRVIKPGGDRTQLPEYLRPNCHKNKDTGYTNVYGRMSWEKPSPTITGGCTTLSKGRFGHPKKLRTISVREAALLQAFPEDYKFSTDYIDQVCVIIGNALPPAFAEAMAKACFNSIQGVK